MKNEYRIPVIDMKATGQRIAKLRKERNLSVRDLQEIFGFTSPQAIYKWQWGESLPEIENLLLLAEIFETTVESILVTDGRDAFSVDCVNRILQ
ncbi:MAG: helix-turn-helix transcriptional regulator [Erysipelotrichaceae bacterium]|nr:helix-turn-helix transcriptional regulator [Erysipelotrichaceae bacterium]